ncbi:MAG: hypothetical protein WKF30_17795 [Pyrinomonadaceae bacterium]
MKLLRELFFPLVAVRLSSVGGIFVWIIGDNPFEVYRLLIGSAFSWRTASATRFFMRRRSSSRAWPSLSRFAAAF